ncbi:MAG: peptidase domain-containing ABC transporter [Pseudomonadota bacterium]|nr:peptidase domain-containing ABC transporter [Pseudomonadota bacterium]
MNGLALHNFTRHFEGLKLKLVHVLWRNYDQPSPLQSAFCAIILMLNPNFKVRALHDALPYRSVWMNMIDIENSLANLGYNFRKLRAKAHEIDERLLPCLYVLPEDKFEWPENPYVIIGKDDNKKRLSVFDCKQEKALFISYETVNEWGPGIAATFPRIQEELSKTSKFIRAGTGYSWFRALMSRFNSVFYQVTLTGFFLNILSLAMPVFIIIVYDRVISTESIHTLYYIIPGILLTVVFEAGLRYLRSKNLSWLAARLGNLVGNIVFSHLIKLPCSYIEQASVSSQISRIRSFEYVRDFFSGPVFLSMLELPFILIVLGVIALLAGNLVWVPLSMSLAYVVLFYIMRRYIRVLIRSSAKASSIKQQFTMETLEKLEDIKTYGLEQAWKEKFRELSGREYWAHFRLEYYSNLTEILANAITILSAVCILGLGTSMVWEGQISIGALVASMILVWRVLTPLYSMCTMIPRIEQLDNSVRQINELMDIENEFQQSKNKVKLKRIHGDITLHNLALRYDENQDFVYRNVNCEIKAGELLAVTGDSGAGKTSFLKTLHSLYKPSKGSIRIDGFDVRQIDPIDLRQHIAYAPQAPDFFYGTIAENLQVANPTASENEIWEALKIAGIDELVEEFPHQLDTVICKPDAHPLSPYFKFQLSLARLYLQNAKIVIIDELPSVTLNSKTGRMLVQYIKNSIGKRTMIIVTHRQDILKLAHHTVTFKNGLPTEVTSQEKEQ